MRSEIRHFGCGTLSTPRFAITLLCGVLLSSSSCRRQEKALPDSKKNEIKAETPAPPPPSTQCEKVKLSNRKYLYRKLPRGFPRRSRYDKSSPLEDFPIEGVKASTMRLPIDGRQDPSRTIRRYGPWLSAQSITRGPRWIQTCVAERPKVMLRDVAFFSNSMPKDFQVMDRNLKMIFDQCGGNLPWTAPVSGKRKVLHYHMEGEGKHCEIELNGFAEPERRDSTQDHIYRVMRGRFKGKIFEYEYLSYQVPELDWPCLKDIVRESGRSFRASWE